MNKAELQKVLTSAGVKFDGEATNSELTAAVKSCAKGMGISVKELTESVCAPDASDTEAGEEKPKTFYTERVEIAEVVQKALGTHPEVKVSESMIATYIFKETVETVKAKVKAYKQKLAKEKDEQAQLEADLKVI